MKKTRKILSVLCAIILLTQFAGIMSYAASGESAWIGAWSTSPVEAAVETNGVKASDFLMGQSVRVVLTPTIDGKKARFKFSNKYGNSDIKITAANVAMAVAADKSEIDTSTIKSLSVNGKTTFTVKKGTHVYTDAVTMKVVALKPIAVSYYVSGMQQMATAGLVGGKGFVSMGNNIQNEAFPNGVLLESNISGLTYNTIPYLINMDVWTTGGSSVVIIGDSTLANNIPELLAEKYVNSGIRNVGVLQQAICGNRLLYDGVGLIGNIYGDAMLTRFSDDALKQFGVKKIFVKIGVNDVLHPKTKSMKGKAPEATVDEIISGYEQLVEKAHAKGIEIYFFEITPWKGYTRELLTSDIDLVWSEEAQSECDRINLWIRKNNSADGYVNLDNLKDSSDSNKLEDIFSEDGIHFTTLAQIAVVDSIPSKYLGYAPSKLISLQALYAEKEAATAENGSGTAAVTSQSGSADTSQPLSTDSSTGNTSVSSTAGSSTEAQSTDEVITNGETNILMNSADLGNKNNSGGIIVDNTPASRVPASTVILIAALVVIALLVITAIVITVLFIKARKKHKNNNITPLR